MFVNDLCNLNVNSEVALFETDPRELQIIDDEWRSLLHEILPEEVSEERGRSFLSQDTFFMQLKINIELNKQENNK